MEIISFSFINKCFLFLSVFSFFRLSRNKLKFILYFFSLNLFFSLLSLIFYKYVDLNFVSTVSSIGRAAFHGLSNHKNYFFILILPILIIFIKGKINSFIEFNFLKSQKNINGLKKNVCVTSFISLIFFITLFYFPNFEIIQPKDSWTDLDGFFVDNWDSSNAVTWAYATKNGLLPFVDFWYPYYCNFLFNLNIPYGPLIQFFYFGLIFLSFYVITFNISKNNAFAILITIAIILSHKNFLSDVDRYLLSINLVGSYLIYNNLKNTKTFFMFLISIIVCLLFEPIQIIYSIPALLFIAITCNLRNLNIRTFLCEIFLFLSFIILIIIFLFLSNIDILSFLGWFLKLNDVTNYMAIPYNLNFNKSNSFYIYTPLIFLFFLDSKEINKENTFVIFMYSMILIALMMMMKHSARPIENQMFIPSFILICFMTLFFDKKNFFIYWGIIFIIISFSLFSPTTQFYKKYISDISTLPSRLIIFKKIINDKVHLKKLIVNDTNIMRLKKINNINFLANRIEEYGYDKFYLLNENPLLYIYKNKKIPYQINNFNLSPIYEQKKQLKYIAESELVIVNKNNFFVDDFNIIVRLPIIQNYIVENFTFIDIVGNYSFLAKKNPSINDLSSWSSILGSKIDYGHIFQNTKLRNYSKCELLCEDYLRVTEDSTVSSESQKILNFEINNLTFTISFFLSKNREAVIKLDNIWFIRLAKKLNLGFKILDANNLKIEKISLEKENFLF